MTAILQQGCKVRFSFIKDDDGIRRPAILVAIPEGRMFRTKHEACKAFLRDLLSTGPMPAVTVCQAALKAGFSPSTLRSTKERMPVISEYHGTPEKHGVWWWRLPDERDKPWWEKDDDNDMDEI